MISLLWDFLPIPFSPYQLQDVLLFSELVSSRLYIFLDKLYFPACFLFLFFDTGTIFWILIRHRVRRL